MGETTVAKNPVRLADAKTGDCVIQATAPFMRNSTAPPELRLVVVGASPKRLTANGTVYTRDGKPVSRAVAGGQYRYLVDPTPERLETLAESDRRRASARREAENGKEVTRINRRIAADWLAHQTDPDEIERLLFNHTLDDVFVVLKQAGVV